MSQTFAKDRETAAVRKLTTRLVPFLFLLYIVAYLDRINVGFAALQMQAQLRFSDGVYGLGAGMFFVGYFFFQVPSNLAMERIGARRWISMLMIFWGFISSSMMFVRTPGEFYALRFLLGTAEAGFFPGMILYLKNWFPLVARARTVAWFMTANPVAGIVGGPISGALLSLQNTGGLAGWQWLFLMEGMPAIILGAVVFFFLTERPEEASWLTPEQRAWLIGALKNERHSPSAVARTDALAGLTSGRVWLFSFVYFGLTTCVYGIVLWLPNLIRNFSQASNFVIGIISTIPYLAAAVAMVLVGFHSDRSGERRLHVALCALTGAAAMLVAAYSASVVGVVAAVSVALMAAEAMLGPFWAMPTSLFHGTAAATSIALINSIGNLGGLFGPYVIGLIRSSTGRFRGGLLVAGATLALSGCAVLLVRVPQAGVAPAASAAGRD